MEEPNGKIETLSSLARNITSTIESWENVMTEYSEKKGNINPDFEAFKAAVVTGEKLAERFGISLDKVLEKAVESAPPLVKPFAQMYINKMKKEPWDTFLNNSSGFMKEYGVDMLSKFLKEYGVDMLSKFLKEYGKDQATGSFRPAQEVIKEVGYQTITDILSEKMFGRRIWKVPY